MSAPRSMQQLPVSNVLPDIYTCGVCGMKITLNVLTEHVLLHDEYSAFSYNETTKIIEPLDEIQELLLQERQVSTHLPAKVEDYQPTAYTYIPGSNNDFTGNSGIASLDSHVLPIQYEKSNFQSAGNVTPNRQSNRIKSYHIAPDLEKKLSTAQLDKLTGIQMIASVAETFGKNDRSGTDSLWTDEFGRLNVDTPLNPGDIIGTLKLPYLENVEGNGEVDLMCECSIVFDRFIGVAGSKDYSVDCKKAEENTGMSLQDIIDGDEVEEDFGDEFVDPDVEFHNENKSEHQQSVPRGGRTGRKMEVYKYREPEIEGKIQNELQKSIVTLPDLLKDPAVIKYLETMTGKTIQITSEEVQHITELPNSDQRGKDSSDVETIIESKNCEKSDSSLGNVINVEGAAEAVNISFSGTDVGKVDEKLDRDLDNKDLKKNRVVIKWDQNTVGMEVTEGGYDQQQSMAKDREESDRKENFEKHCPDEQNGSDNDDEEQEMMDYEISLDETTKTDACVKDISSEVKVNKGLNRGNGVNIRNRKEKLINNTDEKACKVPEIHSTNNDCDMVDDLYPKQISGNSLKFNCSICQKTISSLKNLREHFLTHATPKNKSRESTQAIDKRINPLSKKVTETVNKPTDESPEYMLFYCMVCNKLFQSQTELQEHSKTHREEDYFSDLNVKPDGTSASEDTLTADSDMEDAIEMEKNVPCNRKATQKMSRKSVKKSIGRMDYIKVEINSEAGNEIRENSKEKVDINRKKTISKDYICENCGEGFFQVGEYISHSDQCTDSAKLKCFQGCGYNFKTKSELDFHKKFCSRRIAYLDRVNKELVKRDRSEEPEQIEDDTDSYEKDEGKIDAMFNCPFCGQGYPAEEKMTSHKLVCSKRPKQKCDHCSFECKGDKAMGKHLVEKHNLKPFKCESCSRSFKLKGSLRDHVRYAHTKETFTCEFCGKSFIKQSVYRSHVSIQHEGFRLVCSYCGKKFKDKRTWLLHERSHKGAYEYACAMCKRTFNRADSYRNHMKEVHSIEGKAALSLNAASKELRDKLCSNVCDICKETFPLEAAYTVHMIKVHGQATQN